MLSSRAALRSKLQSCHGLVLQSKCCAQEACARALCCVLAYSRDCAMKADVSLSVSPSVSQSRSPSCLEDPLTPQVPAVGDEPAGKKRRVWKLRDPTEFQTPQPKPKAQQVELFERPCDPCPWTSALIKTIDAAEQAELENPTKPWVCPSLTRPPPAGIYIHYRNECLTCGRKLPNNTCYMAASFYTYNQPRCDGPVRPQLRDAGGQSSSPESFFAPCKKCGYGDCICDSQSWGQSDIAGDSQEREP